MSNKPTPSPKKDSFFGFGTGNKSQVERPRTNTSVMSKPSNNLSDRRSTMAREDDKLPKGFKNKLIELEFQLEKGQVNQQLVHELTDMYT
jgi:hypothetical protein